MINSIPGFHTQVSDATLSLMLARFAGLLVPMATKTSTQKPPRNRRDLIWITVSPAQLEELIEGLGDGLLKAQLTVKLLEAKEAG